MIPSEHEIQESRLKCFKRWFKPWYIWYCANALDTIADGW